MEKNKKMIGALGLTMINVAALGGICNWAPVAECGLSSVFFLALASLLFLIPLSLVTAELATSNPEEGGVYNWVCRAFGEKWGFLAVWFLWVQNVIWYPTALAIIASLIAYVFNPDLIYHNFVNSAFILALFWMATIINLSGVRASRWISTLGAICGTFLPSVLIIGFGLAWYFQGKPMEIAFTKENLVPSLSNISQMGIFAGVIVSLLGIEMSAIHLKYVKNPQKTFPRAILLTSGIVILFSSLGVLAIAMVVPQHEISLNAGPIQAFNYFFSEYKLKAFISPFAIIVALGVLGSVSTWIAGPCNGLLVALERGNHAEFLRKKNKAGMPSNLIFFQAILVSILTGLFIWMPSINSAYWILLVLSTQFYLLMYLLLFGAALKLRSMQREPTTSFRVPGGKFGLLVCCCGGIGMTVFSLVISLFPPPEIQGLSHRFFFLFIPTSVLIVSLIPLLMLNQPKRRPSELQ